MNTVEITEYFEVRDVTELLKDQTNLEDIESQLERVRLPYFTGEREKEQAKIINGLTKELELTEKWIDKASNLIYDFESLSNSKREQYRNQFNKLKEIEKANTKLASDFLERL